MPTVSVTTAAGPGASAENPRPSAIALMFVPDRAMHRQAAVGRALGFFLVAWLCSILLGGALAWRVDARASTLRRLEAAGQLRSMSDRQITDETRSAERVSQVASVAKGLVGTPLELGLACIALLGMTWFFRGRLTGSAVAPVAAASLLPGAVADLLDAVSALRHAAIPPEGAPLVPRTLGAALTVLGHPLGSPWLELGNALDFFGLWSAALLGFGVAAVGKIGRKRALAGTLIAWVCYRLLTHVASRG